MLQTILPILSVQFDAGSLQAVDIDSGVVDEVFIIQVTFAMTRKQRGVASR